MQKYSKKLLKILVKFIKYVVVKMMENSGAHCEMCMFFLIIHSGKF